VDANETLDLNNRNSLKLVVTYLLEAKTLVTNFEFGGSFGMSLEGDCHGVEVTPKLKFLVTFDMSLEGVCQELYKEFHYKLIPNLGKPNIPWKKLPPNYV
jgi:hypothetical protein